MAVSLKHAFQSTVPDGSNTALVRPSNWNAEHVLTLASGFILGRLSSGDGDAEEIDAAALAAFLGYGAAEVLALLLTVDGAGSGLDADLLDGQHASEFQPVDADLTAIAALSTTAFGRGLLELADDDALAALIDSFFLTPAEGNAAYQPLDADLTAIAALTTAAFGRSLLEETSAANAFTTLKQAATDGATGVVQLATVAEIRSAGGTDKVIRTSQLESAAAAVALTNTATVAINWDAGINFSLTVTTNRIIGNPTNGQPGTWRSIIVQGDDATNRTLTFGNQYGGELPTIDDCTSTNWYELTIRCVTTTHFLVSARNASPP